MVRTPIAAILVAIGCALVRPAAAQDAAWSVRASAHIRDSVLAHKPRQLPAGRHAVVVRFNVNETGKISDVVVEKSCGKPKLDQAALAAVRDASPLPAPQRNASDGPFAVTLPIAFANPPGSGKPRNAVRPQRPVTSICRGC